MKISIRGRFLAILVVLQISVLAIIGISVTSANSSPRTSSTSHSSLLTAQPSDRIFTLGQPAASSTVMARTATPSYPWRRIGASTGGTSSASYTASAAVSTVGGASFKLMGSNSAGNAPSNSVAFAASSGGSGGGIKLVQRASKDAGTITSLLLAFPSNNTAGNWIGVCIRAGQVNQTFTVKDSRGNTYKKAIQFSETLDDNSFAIYYAENIAGGANTVTVTDTIDKTLRAVILEYSGVATSSSLDVVAATQGNSATPNSGTAATTANGDLILGAIITGSPGVYTAGSGYSIEESVPAAPQTKVIVEDQIQATAGAASASATLGGAGTWGAGVAAFKAASSGSTTPTITGMSPTSGPVGQAATISGTNLGSTPGTVTFNGIAAATTSWSATSVSTSVPSGATTGNVVVTASGAASNGMNFTVTSGGSGGGIKLVQRASKDAGTITSLLLAFPSNNTAGNWIGVCIRAGQVNQTFTVKDSRGNTYKKAIQFSETLDDNSFAIYYAENIAGGANTVTVTDTIDKTLRAVILEYSGVATSSSLDVVAATQGNSATPNSGTAATTANGDLILGAIITGSPGVYTAGSGYSIEESVPAAPQTKVIVEDQIQATAGAASASATLGGAGTWGAGVAAFKPSGGIVGKAPSITTQPANQSVKVGQTATFSMAASGTTPLNYQWQRNGTAISGATAASYTTPATTSSDNGSTFAVVVTNSAGNTKSNAAVLTVTSNTTPPSVSITFPTTGATVSGTITVTASASHSVGIASVQLQVDGTNVDAADTTTPYDFSLDTITFSNGSHSLTALAKDTSGNQATSAAVSVTVSNSVSSNTPGPLAVCTSNPRYFCDPSSNIVYLAGSHTWSNFMEDRGTISTPPAFDYNGYMTFMASHGFNWMRAWTTEMSHLSTSDDPFEDVIAPPFKWARSTTCCANDGENKFDFTQLDPNYLSRMRARVIQAGQNGIYVSIMLFNGYMWQFDVVSTDGNPFESDNNVNSISCSGTCPSNNSKISAQAWSYEQAYLRRVVDTVHDLPNVMYEVSNEAGASYSTAWEESVIAYVNTYEQTTYGTHHPIGFTFQFSGGSDQTLYDSAADWVAIANGGQGATPPVATGQCPVVTGNGGAANPSSPKCKAVINDTDHAFYWVAMQSVGSVGKINWVWENLTNGNGVAFMDPYLVLWTNRNSCTGAPVGGDSSVCSGIDPQWNDIRSAMADVRTYAKKIDLKNMTPQDTLSTSGFCLASPGSQYLVFSKSNSFTVTTEAGTYTYEWFNPMTHTVAKTGTVTVGSSQGFTAPFSGNSVLWLHK
jgi:hypothetical protein